MSETHPVYIACASGNNAQTDVLITRHGALVRLLGHPQMDFTAEDATRLAYTLLDQARACGWVDPEMDDGKKRHAESCFFAQRVDSFSYRPEACS